MSAGGSGHVSLVPGIPGGPPWSDVPQGRVVPSSLLAGGGMRLMRGEHLPDHWIFAGLWTSLKCCLMTGVVSH